MGRRGRTLAESVRGRNGADIRFPPAASADPVARARAGKHAFVEMPFMLSRASGEAAVAACRQAGVVLALGDNRRILPATAELRRMVAEETLGRFASASARCRGTGG
jgi:predicted dehydrogenase